MSEEDCVTSLKNIACEVTLTSAGTGVTFNRLCIYLLDISTSQHASPTLVGDKLLHQNNECVCSSFLVLESPSLNGSVDIAVRCL